MAESRSVADHWGTGDVLARILEAMSVAGIPVEGLTVEKLAPIDHFHARGFAATKELADILPIRAGDRIVDIGCGIGGPARYLAQRFNCRVDGVDITGPFVVAANKLTAMVGLEDQVRIELGDGQHLPYSDELFDGGYALHVTMNVRDRDQFFGEAFRVLKPGGFFALTEHGLGPSGNPHHPVPWSDDGNGAYLMGPSETVACLERAGFVRIEMAETGQDYLEGYRRVMELARKGELPPFGIHVLLGQNAPEKTKNAARNIEEGRTQPVRFICFKPD
jgi:SAM-dependent methyltransferase